MPHDTLFLLLRDQEESRPERMSLDMCVEEQLALPNVSAKFYKFVSIDFLISEDF